MARTSKVTALAVSLLLTASGPCLAADASAANASQVQQSTNARLDALMKAMEQQKALLERQSTDLATARAEIARQKKELDSLKRSLSNPNAPSLATAEPSKRSPRRQLSASGQPRPIQRSTRLAASPTPQPGTQAQAENQGPSLHGQMAKNDFGALQGIPVRPVTLAAHPASPAESVAQALQRMHTLKDIVRAAVAPTLAAQSEVGQKPKKKANVDIAVLADRGGVLTPAGTLVLDPTIEYSHSSVNRFFFNGVEIVEAVLIGNFLAEDISRDSVTSTIGLRYGITNRLEVDARVPFLYRDDRTFNKALTPGVSNQLVELNGHGLGDIEFGVHYQLNRPKGNFPYFVANLKAKSTTGRGPYDVPYDLQQGLPAELPTGSGFWTLEPSFTMIYPSDPAVLFANVGYQYTIGRNVNKITLDKIETVTGNPTFNQKETITRVGQVDPGGTLDVSLGMGLGLNDAVSMSFGYQQSWVLSTDTHQRTNVYLQDVSGQNGSILSSSTASVSHSQDAQIGQLLLGASIAVSDDVGMNFNIAVGVTQEAPDVTITFRTPLTMKLFK